MNDLLQQIAYVVSQWRDAGTYAGLIALTTLLVYITKLPQVDKHIKPWLKPWIAIATGVLIAFFTALAEHKPWWQALLGGVIVGLGATGLDQAAKIVQPTEQAKKEASKAVSQAMEGERAEVQVKVDAMKAALDQAVAEPDKKARLQKLAALVQ